MSISLINDPSEPPECIFSLKTTISKKNLIIEVSSLSLSSRKEYVSKGSGVGFNKFEI